MCRRPVLLHLTAPFVTKKPVEILENHLFLLLESWVPSSSKQKEREVCHCAEMCSEAVAVESVGSSTSPISRLNPNRLSLGHNQTTPMSRSMERDTCYFCEQKGHWASKCPQKSKPSPSSGSTIIDGRDFPDMPCPCGAGICIVLTSKTTKNPNRKFYRCPAPVSIFLSSYSLSVPFWGR